MIYYMIWMKIKVINYYWYLNVLLINIRGFNLVKNTYFGVIIYLYGHNSPFEKLYLLNVVNKLRLNYIMD